jgi:predicted dehydrogenase
MITVCDVYEPRLLQAAEIVGPNALKVQDYRRILDNREIDAVLIGAPDHWHKRMTLDAVAAGKDVYVEKPVSHTIEEGVEMVKTIEASKQVVQTGTQQRSWEHWVLGKQIVDSGKLGQITFVHTYWYQHARAGTYASVSLEKLDWKQWLGSAPDQLRPAVLSWHCHSVAASDWITTMDLTSCWYERRRALVFSLGTTTTSRSGARIRSASLFRATLLRLSRDVNQPDRRQRAGFRGEQAR